MAKNDRKPKCNIKVPSSKKPKIAEKLDQFAEPVDFRFNKFDSVGPKFKDTNDCNTGILDSFNALKEFESQGWKKIIQDKSNHPMEIKKIATEAQKRWKHLGLSEFSDMLYQFHCQKLGQKQRLWGIKMKNVFFPIWWDPNHKIYVTPKDKGDKKKLNRKRNR